MTEHDRRSFVAEAFGTFALVFAGTGAIVVNEVSGGAITNVGIAVTFGLIVLAISLLLYVFRHVVQDRTGLRLREETPTMPEGAERPAVLKPPAPTAVDPPSIAAMCTAGGNPTAVRPASSSSAWPTGSHLTRACTVGISESATTATVPPSAMTEAVHA